MTSDHHAPYVQGFTHATMAGTTHGDMERIPENRSQFGLESATRLHEGGVASNRGSATPR